MIIAIPSMAQDTIDGFVGRTYKGPSHIHALSAFHAEGIRSGKKISACALATWQRQRRQRQPKTDFFSKHTRDAHLDSSGESGEVSNVRFGSSNLHPTEPGPVPVSWRQFSKYWKRYRRNSALIRNAYTSLASRWVVTEHGRSLR